MSFTDLELTMEDNELLNSYYQLATLTSLLLNHKISFQQLFILIIKDKRINKIAKEILDLNNDYEICKNLLLLDPSLAKSKTLTTFAQTFNA